MAGSGEQRTLCCPLKSMHPPVGKPVAIVGNWQVLLAPVANWLGRRSNAMADDFINRLAGRAEIKKVAHCSKWAGEGPTSGRPSRPPTWRTLRRYAEIHYTSKPRHPRSTDRQLDPVSKYRIPRGRCLSVTRHGSSVKSWPMIEKLPPTPGAHPRIIHSVKLLKLGVGC